MTNYISQDKEYMEWWKSYGELADDGVEYPAWCAGRAAQHVIEKAEYAALTAALAAATKLLDEIYAMNVQANLEDSELWSVNSDFDKEVCEFLKGATK